MIQFQLYKDKYPQNMSGLFESFILISRGTSAVQPKRNIAWDILRNNAVFGNKAWKKVLVVFPSKALVSYKIIPPVTLVSETQYLSFIIYDMAMFISQKLLAQDATNFLAILHM